ncbi:hypothetical protein [Cryobacterium sp. Y62]|uniref:hypothetical protein n=1 Tax=Cryobacterium sp. Y62 TaxID=2048284 RepID=UPI000CE2FF25|nr:hypothetical protein [Cryobacterium sp. Y62]
MKFADVEAMILPFIKARVGSTGVGTKVPNPRPTRYVRAWANGGSAVNRVLERVQITVDVWAASTVEASEIIGDIRYAFLNRYTQMPLVRGVEEVTRPYFNPDGDVDRYRFTIALMVRAAR